MTPKLIFAGTPPIAATILSAMIEHGFIPELVLTQPDRRAGRGRKLAESPVKVLAKKHNIDVLQPQHLKDSATEETLRNLAPDLFVVVAYGAILPQPILEVPTFGCLNVHVSLLPKWRGAAPIAHAILNGDEKTGISFMKMDKGLDTGPVIETISHDILPTDTTESLTEKLSEISATHIARVITNIVNGDIELTVQDDEKASYAHKLEKTTGCIDWQKSAKAIDCQIRALNPWPVAYSNLDAETVRIWHATVNEDSQSVPPGTIVSASKKGIRVQTGEGQINILEAQLPGSKRQPAHALLNANQHPFHVGNCFE